jgi:hypothetical protein
MYEQRLEEMINRARVRYPVNERRLRRPAPAQRIARVLALMMVRSGANLLRWADAR